jgi:hypothetical protein
MAPAPPPLTLPTELQNNLATLQSAISSLIYSGTIPITGTTNSPATTLITTTDAVEAVFTVTGQLITVTGNSIYNPTVLCKTVVMTNAAGATTTMTVTGVLVVSLRSRFSLLARHITYPYYHV